MDGHAADKRYCGFLAHLDSQTAQLFVGLLFGPFVDRFPIADWRTETVLVIIDAVTRQLLVCVSERGRSGRAQINRRFSDRKSTRLNSSHVAISYAVFCLKKKN